MPIHKIPCKVYHDGGHYIATMIFHSNNNSVRKDKSRESLYFDSLYEKSFQDNISKKDKYQYLKDGMNEKYPELKNTDEFVEDKLKSKTHNYYNRLKRFKRKANLNDWNYFVTLTYDGKLMTEEIFRKKLRKCLSNLHSRHNWKYMGVFEKGRETNRLHFHALMFIPDGQMIGTLEEKRDYSTEHKIMQKANVNSFFAKAFGRNDFKPLTKQQLRLGNGINYITKYISKTNEKIVYSRGTKSEIVKDVDCEDIATEMEDFVMKYVLFDDALDQIANVRPFPNKSDILIDNETEEYW